MTSEIKILLYLGFAVSLYIFPHGIYFAVSGAVLILLFFGVPFKRLKSGLLPISLFLIYTFLSNALNSHGRIVFSWWHLHAAEEGLMIAALRTSRVFLLIGGVKVLMASSGTEEVIRAMGRLLSPFERVGLPVADFFHTMTLTIECFPRLKEMALRQYETRVKRAEVKGFRQKARITASFLLPLFVEGIRSPEIFFEDHVGSNADL